MPAALVDLAFGNCYTAQAFSDDFHLDGREVSRIYSSGCETCDEAACGRSGSTSRTRLVAEVTGHKITRCSACRGERGPQSRRALSCSQLCKP